MIVVQVGSIRPADLAGEPGVEAVLLKIIQLLFSRCGFVSSEIINKELAFILSKRTQNCCWFKIYHISFFQ